MSLGPPKPSNVKRSVQEIVESYNVTDDEVEELREWIAQMGWPAALTKTFLKFLDAELTVYAWCETHNHSAKVRYPNYSGFVSVAKLLGEYGLLKMVDRTAQQPRTVIHMQGPDLSQLSLEELRALREGRAIPQIEEGEWQEPPPAA